MEVLAPGVGRVSLRSPTLPPATHTGCYLIGEESLTAFDPASPWEDERGRLLQELREDGRPVERIVLTHHHVDHVSGAVALQAALAEQGQHVPIAAHPVTAELLAGQVAVQEHLLDDQDLRCGGLELRCVHTPGHAPGHLVFHEPRSGMVVAGDMVAGEGTILLLPGEGELGAYLDSLERMRSLGARALLPSHGPVLEQADQVLVHYLAHRHQRTRQVVEALRSTGRADPFSLVARVYPELSPSAHGIAALQIAAHLLWLGGQGVAEAHEDGSWTLREPVRRSG
jgi:ribonuclease/clavin/mitogillin